MGVLEGVNIVEVAGIGPGPFCGMLLADLGADVITIERPGDDRRRRNVQIFNRGKRSMVLDLKKPEAVDVVLRLVERSDALIEGMRPGVMERLGLGPEICLARHPSLVYGRITGWGQYGPMSQAAGHDSNYTGLSGALYYSSPADQPPQAPATVIGDIGGGALYLAVGILSGILNARSTGRGQVVDAAIVDGAAHMLNLMLMMIAAGGGHFERGKQPSDSAHWAGRSYRCADGGWINIAPLEPQFYSELITRLGLGDDERFIKGQLDPKLWPVLSEELTRLFASKSRDEWCALLEGTDACFAPVLSPSEAAKHPHMRARDIYLTTDGVLQTAAAPRFSLTPSVAPGSVPERGAHTDEILSMLRLTASERDALRVSGALAAAC